MGSVCLDPKTLEYLQYILGSNEGNYSLVIPTSVGDRDPYYIKQYQFYALQLLDGLASAFNNIPGSFPLNGGQQVMTLAAAVQDKAIADAVAFRYLVQSINTLSVLLQLQARTNMNTVAGWVHTLEGGISAGDTTTLNTVAGWVHSLEGAVSGGDTAVRNTAKAWVDGEAGARIAGDAATAQAAKSWVDGEAGARIAADQQVANTAKSWVDGLSATVDSLIGQNVTALQGQITNVAEQAVTEVHNAVVEAEQYATALSASAVPTAVAQAVAALQPQISKIAADTAECLDPLCSTVTPNAKQLGNLGKLLSGLTDVGLLGILLAVLKEAASHPGQLATDIENDLGGLVSSVSGELRSLIGV